MTIPGLREEIPLGPRTTLGAGGPARFFLEATTEDEIIAALAWARSRDLPALVLGGGSNLLVSDRGVDALVVRVRLRGVTAALAGEVMRVEAAAGEPWDDLVARAVESGWAGIECLSGIPGDVGATPIQNVGAYGQEVAETITRVRAVRRDTGAIVEMSGAECAFGYRDSAFKRDLKDAFVITRVTFYLRPGGSPAVRYAELSKKLAGHASPSLAEVRATVLELRRAKSMLLDPSGENGKSAGSFFTNPIVNASVLAEAAARASGEAMPTWPAEDGKTKLSAAWLIEHAGFAKGFGEGRVGLSTKHTLAIVNRGGATATEIVAFAKQVKRGVYERFAVELQPEPVMIGFSADDLSGLVS